ncbi:MAG: TniB family NTP-binding protein [Trichlorobacter sp.]
MVDEKHVGRLLPEARELLHGSLDERIAYIRQDRWLPYPAADRLLDKMESLFNMPPKVRAPSMLVAGDSHCGKTSLVRRFRDMHPPTDDMYEAACPVFYLGSCPSEPDEGRLYDEILKELKIPFRYSDKPSKKYDEVKYQFDQIGVRVLILDEISHALSGSALKQRVFMNAIKNIHNSMQRPIILVGTHDAQFATGSDRQFASRFKLEKLGRWKEDDV